MKKPLILLLTALAFISCAEKKERLHIYNWSEYLDLEVVADFEKRYDCEIILDLYEDTDTMLAKMLAGGDSMYDIIFPESPNLPIFVKRGLLSPINPEAIPNLKNIDPVFKDLEANPNFKYGPPYFWGTTGIFMRKPMTPDEESWGILFDPEKQSGPFLLLDDMRQTIGMALQYLGHSINTTDPELLSQARDLLIETKKRALGFEGTVLGMNRVLSKEVSTSVIYSADAAKGAEEDTDTLFFTPKNTGIMWQDIMAIPANAPHRDLAEKFINFMLEPEIAARNANFIMAATPNKAAREFLDPAQRNSLVIYPPTEVISKMELVEDVGEASKLFDEVWAQIKSK